ncbi:hypothetical protein N7532_002351 [Penicillium argentinense]|uniref:Uncharacterized protein n=1 Tax=Penicillium argentinense TaxID=1131581 RepID=A0A9W9G066_9EURO|nr:uncharacterized protein N7532_002351 [Penicillium argentinense]KAJ5109706.1 hypothetical protein N7532_002351 [Penicillium argentinense]
MPRTYCKRSPQQTLINTKSDVVSQVEESSQVLNFVDAASLAYGLNNGPFGSDAHGEELDLVLHIDYNFNSLDLWVVDVENSASNLENRSYSQ